MEREPATRARIERFLRELSRRYHGAGRLYLAGGAMMVYSGFRGQTEDILPRLETESLRVDEQDYRRKFEGVLQLARKQR